MHPSLHLSLASLYSTPFSLFLSLFPYSQMNQRGPRQSLQTCNSRGAANVEEGYGGIERRRTRTPSPTNCSCLSPRSCISPRNKKRMSLFPLSFPLSPLLSFPSYITALQILYLLDVLSLIGLHISSFRVLYPSTDTNTYSFLFLLFLSFLSFLSSLIFFYIYIYILK